MAHPVINPDLRRFTYGKSKKNILKYYAMGKKHKKHIKNPIQKIEHRGNDQEVRDNYLAEIKLVRKAPMAYYSLKGGILDI